MQTFAVFGNPIKHSKSPSMHNYFFKTKNINASYLAICLENSEEIKSSFEENNLNGANITVPFKEDAFRLCDEVYGIAKKAQSVNTIIKKDNKLLGYNTDGDGFWHSIAEDFGENIKNALILGAGGTAKSIAHTLRDKNVETSILNRSEQKLQYFKQQNFKCFTHDNFKTSNYNLIINTTSAGLNDESLPLQEEILKEIFKKSKYAYDVIYNKKTSFISLAKTMGMQTQNGKNMLIYQGAFANLKFMDNKFTFEETALLLKQGFDK